MILFGQNNHHLSHGNYCLIYVYKLLCLSSKLSAIYPQLYVYITVDMILILWNNNGVSIGKSILLVSLFDNFNDLHNCLIPSIQVVDSAKRT